MIVTVKLFVDNVSGPMHGPDKVALVLKDILSSDGERDFTVSGTDYSISQVEVIESHYESYEIPEKMAGE